MILVGISGSTKCDWTLIKNKKKVGSTSTDGLSPFFNTEQSMIEIIKSNKKIAENKEEFRALFFFGAGCSNKTRKMMVERAMETLFPSSVIYVNHDVVAYAFATYDGVPAITGILGTGSNSVFYDGDIVREEIPALDYILGDEGGGAYYGKQLLKDFLYNSLPGELSTELKNEYDLTKDIILENVYMKPLANVYLASFMSFLQKNIKHPYVGEMVDKGMGEFMDKHICCYRNYQEYKTHFVGSVAHYFSNHLKEAAKKRQINVGKIIKEPVSGLVDYYLTHFKDTLPL